MAKRKRSATTASPACLRRRRAGHLSFTPRSASCLQEKNTTCHSRISFYLRRAAKRWMLPLEERQLAGLSSILEMQWSGVGLDDWWRNEQFWVTGGVSAHLFAVFQGLLKVPAEINTNFTVTAKAADDTEFGELYIFRWTSLLIPSTTLIVINLVGVVAGILVALNSGYQSWGPLFGKIFFAFWVILHLYLSLKGLMGRQNRTLTIVIVWPILLASTFSLLWGSFENINGRTSDADDK